MIGGYVSGYMPLSTEYPWFAVRVKSNFEHTASAILRGKGYEELSPTYKVRRGEMPLFPGYVFARFDPDARLPILTTPGVVHIVGNGKTPAPIDEIEMRDIRRIASSDVGAQPWPFTRIGQRITIRRGALEGVEGLLLQVKNRHRLVVSITMLQRSLAVELDDDWVRPA
jgi:transcription antitermination factor NusG